MKKPVGTMSFDVSTVYEFDEYQDVIDSTGEHIRMWKSVLSARPSATAVEDYEFIMRAIQNIEEYKYIIFYDDGRTPKFFLPPEKDGNWKYASIPIFGDAHSERENRAMFFDIIKAAVADTKLTVFEIVLNRNDGLCYYLKNVRKKRIEGKFKIFGDALRAAKI